MKGNKILLVFFASVLAIVLTGCDTVKINSKVFVTEHADYTFTTDMGTYTYRVVLEPRKGSISGTTLGTTTKDSKLVVYRDDLPREMPVIPGVPPKATVHKIQSFEIKSGAKYVKIDLPDKGKTLPVVAESITTAVFAEVTTAPGITTNPEANKTAFEITIDIATDIEGHPDSGEENEIFYLVDFKVRKQT